MNPSLSGETYSNPNLTNRKFVVIKLLEEAFSPIVIQKLTKAWIVEIDSPDPISNAHHVTIGIIFKHFI